MKYIVSESDNTACDVLLRLVGEPKIVTQYLQDLGINDMVVANTEKELGQDRALHRNNATVNEQKIWRNAQMSDARLQG